MPTPSVSSARAAQAGANVRRTARPIDFSDIPEASTGQLKAMRRVGRPPLGDRTRQVIAIRVDAGVLDQFWKEARRRRVGYQTLINQVLAAQTLLGGAAAGGPSGAHNVCPRMSAPPHPAAGLAG